MGRNIKQGLSYFPVDVDIFEDEKIQFVSAIYGPLGEGITIRLLCRIYRNGYFIFFDDDVALLFSRSTGDISLLNTIKGVVDELLKREFFDRGMFENYKILTSAGIQRRYNKICADAKRINYQIDPKFDLLRRKLSFTPEETTEQHGESTQRKEKESIGEESKGVCVAPAPPVKGNHSKIDSFESLSALLNEYEWMSDVCEAKGFDILDFQPFVNEWLTNKRLSGDWAYPPEKIKKFVIEDFEKHTTETGANNNGSSKLDHNEKQLQEALELLKSERNSNGINQ